MECGFVLFFELVDMFCNFPRISAGDIVLVARFLPEFCPQLSEHKVYAHEVPNAEYRDGPFLFLIFTWRKVPFEKCKLLFGPKNFVPFRKTRLGFRWPYILKRTAELLRILHWGNSTLFHHFSSASCWTDCQPQFV